MPRCRRVPATRRPRRKSGRRTEKLLVCVGPSPVWRRAACLALNQTACGCTARKLVCGISREPGPSPIGGGGYPPHGKHFTLPSSRGPGRSLLSGQNVAEELLTPPRQKNITKIVVGKPELPRWREWLRGSIVDDLIRRSGAIDIYVMRHERAKASSAERSKPAEKAFDPKPYLYAGAICLLATLIGAFVYHVLGNHGERFSNTNALMLDLLAILFIASRFAALARRSRHRSSRGRPLLPFVLHVSWFRFYAVHFHFHRHVVCRHRDQWLTDRIRRQADVARDREPPHRRPSAAWPGHRKDGERAEIVKRQAYKDCRSLRQPRSDFPRRNKKRNSPLPVRAANSNPMDEKELGVIRWVFRSRPASGSSGRTRPPPPVFIADDCHGGNGRRAGASRTAADE